MKQLPNAVMVMCVEKQAMRGDNRDTVLGRETLPNEVAVRHAAPVHTVHSTNHPGLPGSLPVIPGRTERAFHPKCM
ncbi:unnamed protein product [Arctogadus glacialis]